MKTGCADLMYQFADGGKKTDGSKHGGNSPALHIGHGTQQACFHLGNSGANIGNFFAHLFDITMRS
jgi:hypothetical protein